MNPNRVRHPGAGDLGQGEPPQLKAPTVKPRKQAAQPRRPTPVALLEDRSRDGELRPVTIDCHQPAAREVFLAGAFNDWQPRATPMARQRDGRWSATLLLKPGAYEYRLVVDGQWQEDPKASRFAVNPFGGRNSVIEVRRAQA